MKCYFHCNVNIYRKKVRTFLEYTAVPVVSVVVFLAVCLLLSFRNLIHSQLLVPAVLIVCAVIFAFALATRIMLQIAEHRVRVHSKYTYIEMGMKDVIVSLYAGSFVHWGRVTVLRRLLLIPLDGFESAEVDGNGRVLVRTKTAVIRHYIGNTDRLGYYFKDGTFQFKEFYYQESGFTALERAVIPGQFGEPQAIVDSIYAAVERYENLPPPAPYVFEEMPFVKTRKIREKTKLIRGY